MISVLCYAIVFVIETIISIFYFNNKFKLKRNKEMIFLVAFISSVISFSVAKLNTPALNLLSFFVCNFLILILCYEVNIKSSLFHSFLLLSFMIVTEILVGCILLLYIFQLNFLRKSIKVIDRILLYFFVFSLLLP